MPGQYATQLPQYLGREDSVLKKMVKKSEDLQAISDTMNDYWTTNSEIGNASVSACNIIYGRKSETLTKTR